MDISKAFPALTSIATAGLILLGLGRPGNAELQVRDVVETYGISGHTGAELYASIGQNGPLLGQNRVIAHTRFTLTWRRDYQTRGTDCVLASAVPKLTLITTLPKPNDPLPQDVRVSWATFLKGVRAHEAVHGLYVRDLVQEIEAATIGLVQPNDPDCRTIKAEMNRRLGAISDRRRERDRDFDRREFTEGGTVHALILALVNGP